FFTFYVFSVLVAGGKFFQISFNIEYHTGVLILAAVVIAYTLFGGFLAVCYTDAVYGLIMFFALMMVPIVGIFVIGGVACIKATILDVNLDIFHLFTVISVFTFIF